MEHLEVGSKFIAIIEAIHFIVTKYDIVGSDNAGYSGLQRSFHL